MSIYIYHSNTTFYLTPPTPIQKHKAQARPPQGTRLCFHAWAIPAVVGLPDLSDDFTVSLVGLLVVFNHGLTAVSIGH